MEKKTSFGPDFGIFDQIRDADCFFFSKNLAPSVTRYHCQLSLCAKSEKTNGSILRKLSDGRTDGQTD